jgi:hypothetical protein
VTSPAPFPFGVTVKVNRDIDGPSRYGDVTRTYHHSIDGCALAPRYSSEVNENRTSVIVGFSLFGPPQTGDNRIFAGDEVETPDGLKWRVVGEAAEWVHPITGWQPGFEAAVERVK